MRTLPTNLQQNWLQAGSLFNAGNEEQRRNPRVILLALHPFLWRAVYAQHEVDA